MQRVVFGLLLLVAGVFCDVINPPKCSSGQPGYGPGDATDTSVSVTGLTGAPKYTMYTGTTYTCNITFTAQRNVANPKFDIFAHSNAQTGSVNIIGLLNVNVVMQSLSALTAGETRTASGTFTINPLFAAAGLLSDATFYGRVYDGDAGAPSDDDTIVCYQGTVDVKLPIGRR